MSLKLTKSIIVGALLFSVGLSACGEAGGGGSFLLADTLEVDPQFQELYNSLGGEDIMGPAISPWFTEKHVHYQYTVAALLVFDPYAPESQQYQLGALANEAGISEPPVPPPDDPNARYVNGHIIDPAFVEMYRRLGGARYAGKPVTEMFYNAERRRFEQHFENIGMYWYEYESPAEVHLLAYGIWMCGSYCPYNGSAAPVDIPPRVHDSFVPAYTRLGGDFIGFPLSEAYLTPDGFLEQVFEHVVLVSVPDQPGQVILRPLPKSVGINPEPLVPPSTDPEMYFYPVQDGLGYNIPLFFLDYMAAHGGKELAGPPITEYRLGTDDVYGQCFGNYCLQAQNDGGKQIIKPKALGRLYRQLPPQPVFPTVDNTPGAGQVQPEVAQQGAPAPEQATPVEPAVPPLEQGGSSQITVQVWERHPVVAPNQSQEIGVLIYEDNQPVPNIEPDLQVNLPDNTQKTYYMYPTDSNGRTQTEVDPLDLPSGTVIPYQVCVYEFHGVKFCLIDDYLIWQGP